MNVTRDVILDLMPLVAAGEASQDTQALVAAYLEQDPALAALAKTGMDELALSETPGPPLSKEHELKTIERTKAMLRLQRILMGVAMFFTFLPLAGYQVGQHRWAMLSEFPAGAIASAVIAVASWVAYFTVKRRVSSAGV